ncbi:MAG TPA: L,D-transpeptidase family protein [Stellaceae bacterium]|nr:L,D-transpeptidase family protein [Stellaceae bacterium]
MRIFGMTIAAVLGLGLAGAARGGEPLPTVDAIEVFKARHELVLLRNGTPIKTYRISLGTNPAGPKQQQGDHRTPEGRYVIDFHNRASAFHLSLHVSYPNAQDRKQAAARHVSPGGDIMIHGLPNGMGSQALLFQGVDWTDGCIAVTDAEIEEIARAVPDGTPITIHP